MISSEHSVALILLSEYPRDMVINWLLLLLDSQATQPTPGVHSSKLSSNIYWLSPHEEGSKRASRAISSDVLAKRGEAKDQCYQ